MMNDKTGSRAHWSFWAIGAVALVWNVMGALNFFMQMNVDALARMPETQRAIIESRPAWATAAFAVVVFCGVIGCLLLLLKKTAAYYLFLASLLGVVVQIIPYLGASRSAFAGSPLMISMYIIVPLAVAAFLAWYAKRAERKGWMNLPQRQ